jgi:hypothetical protein
LARAPKRDPNASSSPPGNPWAVARTGRPSASMPSKNVRRVSITRLSSVSHRATGSGDSSRRARHIRWRGTAISGGRDRGVLTLRARRGQRGVSACQRLDTEPRAAGGW